MNLEIERRFLIKNNQWRNYIINKSEIIQGYLNSNSEDWIVRIRLEKGIHTLTLKKHIVDSSCYEFEYEIPSSEGKIIISHLQEKIIKERSYLTINNQNWVVDSFKEQNFPLEIAEIELKNKNERIEIPEFISKEITGLKAFSNFCLSTKPFSSWEKQNIIN